MKITRPNSLTRIFLLCIPGLVNALFSHETSLTIYGKRHEYARDLNGNLRNPFTDVDTHISTIVYPDE